VALCLPEAISIHFAPEGLMTQPQTDTVGHAVTERNWIMAIVMLCYHLKKRSYIFLTKFPFISKLCENISSIQPPHTVLISSLVS
jgi:hypothetical protein